MLGSEEDEEDEDENDGAAAADKEGEVVNGKKEKRAENYTKIEEAVKKMEGAVGKSDKEKMNAAIQKYEEALQKLIAEANADGTIDAEEQKQIDVLSKALDALKENNKNGKAKKITPEQKVKIKDNMVKISARLEKIVSELGLEI